MSTQYQSNSCTYINGEIKELNESQRLLSNKLTNILISTTQSTDIKTGALVVTGGVGIGGNLNVGGSLIAKEFLSSGNKIHVLATDASTDVASGALIVDGGTGIAGKINAGSVAVGTSYSFISNPTTKIYNPATNKVTVNCGGTDAMAITSSDVVITGVVQGNSGSSTVPSYTFSADTKTGISNNASKTVSVICDGSKIMSVSPTGVDITGGLTLTGTVKMEIISLTTGALTVADSDLSVVNGDGLFNQNIVVGGNSTLDGNLYVGGTGYFNDNTYINGKFETVKLAQFHEDVEIGQDLSVDGIFNSYGVANFSKEIITGDKITIGGNANIDNLTVKNGSSLTGSVTVNTGNISINTEGYGLKIKEGITNAKMGTATLYNGSITIFNGSVSSSTRFFLTHQQIIGTAGILCPANITSGLKFDITSTSATDNSVVAWLMVDAI